jgi:hypothetical protein
MHKPQHQDEPDNRGGVHPDEERSGHLSERQMVNKRI